MVERGRTLVLPFEIFFIFILKNTIMKLKAFNKEYNLDLIVDKYVNNNRTYFWLVDTSDGEPFADLSENHVEISDDEIFWRLPGHEAIIIDNDFLNCFDSIREAKIWIKDNISQCVITWDIDWLDCFYVKCETSES